MEDFKNTRVEGIHYDVIPQSEISKINKKLISKYANLKVLVESFPELLFPNHNFSPTALNIITN
jgi:hypothetical protein